MIESPARLRILTVSRSCLVHQERRKEKSPRKTPAKLHTRNRRHPPLRVHRAREVYKSPNLAVFPKRHQGPLSTLIVYLTTATGVRLGVITHPSRQAITPGSTQDLLKLFTLIKVFGIHGDKWGKRPVSLFKRCNREEFSKIFRSAQPLSLS